MQLLYFCMLLTSIAMPLLPMLFYDHRPEKEVMTQSQSIASELRQFDESYFGSLESIVAMLTLIAVYATISKLLEWHLNRLITDGNKLREVAEQHLILKRFLQWSWIVVAPFYLALTGWGDMPSKLLGEIDSLAWSLSIWMMPTLLMVILLDAQSARWRRRLMSIIGYSSQHRDLASWLGAFWSQARHTWFMIFAMPLAACLAIDLSSAGLDFWSLNRTAQLSLGLLLAPVLVFVVPYAMLWCWSTEPLEGIEDDCSVVSTTRVAWIREVWEKHVSKSPRVLYWSTNHSISCAMVVGWLPPLRCLVLSDVLLQQLNDNQLRMVILHESAHVQRFHVSVRLLAVFVATICLSLWFQPSVYANLSYAIPRYASLIYGLTTLGLVIAMLLIISKVAKWTEFDADQYAIELSTPDLRETGESNVKKMELAMGAARGMIQALEKTVPRSYHRSPGWLHPSVEQRRLRIVQRYFKDDSAMVESAQTKTTLGIQIISCPKLGQITST